MTLGNDTTRLSNRGFTLIEVLIAVSIGALLILTVVFLDIGPRGKPSVDAATQQLSVFYRQALAYGLAIVGTNNNFDVGYGVHIRMNATQQALLFVDVDKDGVYDTVGDTILSTLTLPSDARIKQYCVRSGANSSCVNAGGSQTLDVAFSRASFVGTITPSPSAAFTPTETSIYVESITKPSIVQEVKLNRSGLVEIIGI